MTKVKITYSMPNDTKTRNEVVEQGSDRYNELCKLILLKQINGAGVIVDDDEEMGLISMNRDFRYREQNGTLRTLTLEYQVDFEESDEPKLKYFNFEPFRVLGFLVTKFHDEEYGDLLELELSSRHIKLKTLAERKDICYAIRKVSDINRVMLEQLEKERNDAINREEQEEIRGWDIK